MRLVYGAAAFEGIVSEVASREVTEKGIDIAYSPSYKEGLMLGDKDRRTVFLNSSIKYSLAQVKHFIIDAKKPGLLIISARSYMKSKELMNQLLLHHILPMENVVFLGQHEYSKGELSFIKGNGLHFFPMSEVYDSGHFEVSEGVMSILKKFRELYILIDSSVLDSSVISVGRPGGIMPRELVFFMQRFKHLKPLNTMELIIPPAERELAVKLLSEMYVDSR